MYNKEKIYFYVNAEDLYYYGCIRRNILASGSPPLNFFQNRTYTIIKLARQHQVRLKRDVNKNIKLSLTNTLNQLLRVHVQKT